MAKRRYKFNGKLVGEQTKTEFNNRLAQAMRGLRNYAREKSSRPNPTGRDPSRPGEYPKRVTGRHVRGIRVVHDRKKASARLVGLEKHSMWLQTGYSADRRRMLPRPWLSKAWHGFYRSFLAALKGTSRLKRI